VSLTPIDGGAGRAETIESSDGYAFTIDGEAVRGTVPVAGGVSRKQVTLEGHPHLAVCLAYLRENATELAARAIANHLRSMEMLGVYMVHCARKCAHYRCVQSAGALSKPVSGPWTAPQKLGIGPTPRRLARVNSSPITGPAATNRNRCSLGGNQRVRRDQEGALQSRGMGLGGLTTTGVVVT
jgi:hypothetical protein